MKTIVLGGATDNQCRKPKGWVGNLILRNMNKRHAGVTDWGLSHVSIAPGYTILDVGCGGGRTLAKLAVAAVEGKVYGLDHSEASVAASARINARAVAAGRVEVRQGDVSRLPYPDAMFDLVTAVETHIWWPDLPLGLREILRVLKPGGRLAIVSEVYRGANTKMARACERYAPQVGMTLLDPAAHRELLAQAGYADVRGFLEESKGWICALGSK